MYTVTWIHGSTLGAVSTPKEEYAATLVFALRAFGFNARVWHGNKLVGQK